MSGNEVVKHQKIKTSISIAVGLIAVCALCRSLTAQAPPFITESEHYTIKTDTSREFAKLIATHMDALYGEYEERFSSYAMQRHNRATIKVFDSRRAYDRAAPEFMQGTAGAFSSEKNLIMAFRSDRTNEDVLKTLYHEGFHQFLYDRVGENMPLWLNEGFAEYFAEAIWDGREFHTGSKPHARLLPLQRSLERGRFIQLRHLFRFGQSDWLTHIRQGDPLARLQYDQAWSVIHFLQHGHEGKFQDRLIQYLRLHVEGVGPDAAFRKSFGTDIDGMQRAWRAYVLQLEPDALSQCRYNINIILSLAKALYDTPHDFTGIEELTEKMSIAEEKWEFRGPYGNLFSFDATEGIKKMLLCPPCDVFNGDKESDYLLHHNEDTGLPEIYCLNHDGILLKGYFKRRDSRWETRTEMLVRSIICESHPK